MTNETAAKSDERLEIPLDLTEWVAESSLCSWLIQKVDSLNWANPELVDYLERHPSYRPRELLIALTLSYATGVFNSEDVEAKCYRHATFLSLFSRDTPTISQIRRFRKDNRGLLKWLLAEILREALREKYAMGDALLPPGLRRYLQDLAIERLNLARHMDRCSSDC